MTNPITQDQFLAAIGPAAACKPEARKIINDVCVSSNVSYKDMIGPSRRRDHAWPRQYAMWRLRTELGMSFPNIGSMFGDRDHTTVIHAVRSVDKRMTEADQ